MTIESLSVRAAGAVDVQKAMREFTQLLINCVTAVSAALETPTVNDDMSQHSLPGR